MNSSYLQGTALYQLGRITEALDLLLKAHAEDPHDPNSLILMAWCYGQLDWPNEGVRAAEQALALDPENVRALEARTGCLFRCSKFKQAEANIKLTLEIDAESSFSHYMLAQLHSRCDRHKLALECIQEALRLEPNDEEYLRLLSKVLLMLGDRSGAKASSLQALRQNPEASLSHVQFGTVLRRSGEIYEAIQSNFEALRNDPTDKAAKNHLLLALRSRFFIFRWQEAWDFRVSRFSKPTRITLIAIPIVLMAIVSKSSRNPNLVANVCGALLLCYLFLSLVSMFLPSILDGFIAFEPKYRIVFQKSSRNLARASCVLLLCLIFVTILCFALQNHFLIFCDCGLFAGWIIVNRFYWFEANL